LLAGIPWHRRRYSVDRIGDRETPQTVVSIDAHHVAADNATPRPLRFRSWLAFLVFVVGLIALLSYSLSGTELLRSNDPGFASWWETHQFYFMEGGATGFGILLAVCIGGSFVAGPDRRSRAGSTALVLAIIALAPLTIVCAAAARLGWNGRGASLASWLISREGYETGRQIDKVVIAGVYFLKTIGLAFLNGLGLLAIACVAVFALEAGKAHTDQA
jgi:hypothetical protein